MIMTRDRDDDASRRPSDESMNQAVVEIMQVLSRYGMTLTEGVGVLESIQYDLLAQIRGEDTELCE